MRGENIVTPIAIIVDEQTGREILRERDERTVQQVTSMILNNRIADLTMLGEHLGLERTPSPRKRA
jgi:hypothetical protein